MKKIISFDVGYNTSVDQKIANIKSAGFDGVFIFGDLKDQTIQKIIKSGFYIETIHLPYRGMINSIWIEAPQGDECVNVMINGIEKAHRHGIKTVVMHTSSSFHPPKPCEAGIRRLRHILKTCEEKQVFLALENIKRLDYLDYVFENLESKYLKFCFDCGHAHAFTHNLDAFPWSKYKDRLWCLHLHDNDGMVDQHLMPYLGTINWKSLIHQVFKHNADLNLTLELYYFDREQFYQGIDEKDFMKKAFESLYVLEQFIP